jgi:hypothetical protein
MRAAVVILVCCFAVSAYAVVRNQRAFRIKGATHAQLAEGEWYAPGATAEGFKPVDLPYFRAAGFFRVQVESSQSVVDIDLWAQSCLTEVYLDGRSVYRNDRRCRTLCQIFHTDGDLRCQLTRVSLDLGTPGEHLLAVATKGTGVPREPKLFWVQHETNAFVARLLALCSGVALLALAVWRMRGGKKPSALVHALSFLRRRRAFLMIALLATAFRVAAAPGMLTGDVSRSALIYTENLVNRKDLHFAKVDPQYAGAARYSGKSHMHKPPGVYYQYAALRLVFGFSDVYFRYLTRVPGALGDILIAWVLLTVIEARRRDNVGLATAAYFLFGAGVFANSGLVGRIDSLPLAFLMLALKNIGNRKFSLFLGLAVAWKQLALLAVPWFLFRKATFRPVLWAGVVTLLLCAPYLLDDPKLFLERLVMPQVGKGTGGLAWLRNLAALGFSEADVAQIYRYLMLGYFAMLLVLPWVTRPDPWMAVAISFCLFLVCGKNVHEHYILWSLPPLLMTYVRTQNTLVGVGLLVGMLSAGFYHEPLRELGGDITPGWALLFGGVYAVVVVQMLRMARRARAATDAADEFQDGMPHTAKVAGPWSSLESGVAPESPSGRVRP